jgi:hypothetical protein
MNNFWKLTDSERKTVILQTGIRKNNLFPQVVEKDLLPFINVPKMYAR